MGKRRTLKLIGRCQVMKTFKKGKDVVVNMRCGKRPIKRIVLSAQDIINSIK